MKILKEWAEGERQLLYMIKHTERKTRRENQKRKTSSLTKMDQTLYLRLIFIAVYPVSECFQRRYHYINMNMNWTEAQNYCRENYTDLATVNNINDMNELKKTVTTDGNVWIGLKNRSTATWKWSLGDPVDYKNWMKEEQGHKNCVLMKNGKWYQQECNKTSNFICYNDSSQTNIFVNSDKNWRDAQSFCRQNHTDLTSVRNQTENEKIQNIINNTETPVWIGLFRDSCEWSDNSNSTFRHWRSIEPNGGPDPQCTEIQMKHQGRWNDAGCQAENTFVCYEDKLMLIKENLTWPEALKYCRENQMDLVSVDSQNIQKRLKNIVKDASTAEVWLGLRLSCTVGIWFWVNGEFTCYENWAEGNETAMENCETVMRSGAVQSGEDHLWISLPETKRRNFICSR